MAKTLAGLDATLKDLEALSQHLQDGLKREVAEGTVRLQRDAVSRAPKATGTLQNAIRHIFFDKGNTGSVYVARMQDARKARYFNLRTRKYVGGARRPKFPLYLEYGTVNMRPRPYLIPAFEAEKSRFERGVQAMLDSAPKG